MTTKAATAQLELERTYDVPADFVLPDLTAVDGVTAADPPMELVLEAVYVDTEDQRLLRARTTLRRRTGGVDDGWHLKLPVSDTPDGRLEVHRPAGRAGTTPPVQLRRLVTTRTAGVALLPVLTLRTRRTVQVLRGAGGASMAEVCLDSVTTTVPGDVAPSAWTELEVELTGGDPALLDSVQELLLGAGATVSAHQSKARRALGPPPAPAAYDLDTAGGVVLARVHALVETLAGWDVALRHDAPRAVHQMRVTVRRLRNVLAMSRRLLDRQVTDPVRAELGWLAGVLGAVRDDEVLRAGLTALLDDQAGPALGRARAPARRRLTGELTSRERADRAAAHTALDSDRYVELWASLHALVDSPPLDDRGVRPSGRELRTALRKTWQRLDAECAALVALPPGPDRDVALHEVRKSGKRLRYALEATRPALDESQVRRMLRRLERFQEYAGALRDDQLALERLSDLAEQPGGDAFVLGHLHGALQARVTRRERMVDSELARLDARKLRNRLTRD